MGTVTILWVFASGIPDVLLGSGATVTVHVADRLLTGNQGSYWVDVEGR